MGFDVGKLATTYVLEFDEAEYEGLEIRMLGLSLGELFKFDEAEEAVRSATGLVATYKAVRARNELFASKVDSWNLEQAGIALPVTADAIESLEPQFVTNVVTAWRRAVVAVPVPLAESSTSGPPSPVESIPMETLSPNQAA